MRRPDEQLDEGSVHIWTVRLDGSERDLAAFDAVLSAEERAQAARFAFPHLRRSFVFSRGVLRSLVGNYTATAAAAVSFLFGPQGKPSLAGPGRLRFNVSHSGGYAMLAFALDSEIGVDIEEIRDMPELLQIASQFFCPAEEAGLRSVPGSRRPLAFALCWTRKEAFIKAKGGGLSIPLHSFQVSLAPEDETRFVVLPAEDAATAWNLHNLDAPPGFAAALAYPGAPRPLRMLPPCDAATFHVLG